MDEIFERISFGVGRKNDEPVDHPVLDAIRERRLPPQRRLLPARRATSSAPSAPATTTSTSSRATTASSGSASTSARAASGTRPRRGFLALAAGPRFGDRGQDGEMDSPPVLLHVDSELGTSYIAAMELAGEYAYAGRDVVVDKVLEILGAQRDLRGPQPPQLRLARAALRRRRVGHPQGLHARVPRPGGLRRRDDGRAVGDPARHRRRPTAPTCCTRTVHGAGRVMSRTQAAGRGTRAECGERDCRDWASWGAVPTRARAARGIDGTPCHACGPPGRGRWSSAAAGSRRA